MTKSREDLVLAALAIVHADGGTGQAPEAEDTKFVDSCVDSMFSTLGKLSIYPFCDHDAIEEDAFEYLAVFLANVPRVRSHYGLQADVAGVAEARSILLEITAAVDAGEPVRALYF